MCNATLPPNAIRWLSAVMAWDGYPYQILNHVAVFVPKCTGNTKMYLYGKALPGQHGNIVQLVMNRLNAGQEIRVVSDQWRTPTYVGDVSAGVQHLVENAANGIFHICGEECLTIAEIAFQVADYMKLDRSLVHPATTEEMQEATPRPRFSGMSIAKARTILGYQPRKLKDILMEWKH